MNISRRVFIRNGLGVLSTGLALPQVLFSDREAQAQENLDTDRNRNLLTNDVYFGGSSFRGTVDYAKNTIATENYYPTIADGNTATGWRPMEDRGPHWLEMRWRYPVTIDAFRMAGQNIDTARVEYWHDNKFVELLQWKGNSEVISFPAIKTVKVRVELSEFNAAPIVNEIGLFGPPQANIPAILPKTVVGDEKFTIGNVQINQKAFAPGETIKLSCDISSPTVLKDDCVFLVELREESPNDYFREQFGDFEIGGVAVPPEKPTSRWAIGEKQALTAEIELPYFAPQGKTFISIMALKVNGQSFVPVENPATGNKNLIEIEIVRAEKIAAKEEAPQTQITDSNGQRGFQLGSDFKPPFFNRYMCTCDFERLYDSKANGLDIQYFLMYSSCIRPREQQQDFVDRLHQQITSTLRVRPESYFMIGMDLRVSRDWLEANKTERMLNRHGEVIIEKISPSGLVSYGSGKYLQDCYAFIDRVIDFIKAQPYAGRVIGYYPYACSQNDAFIGGVDNNRMIKERDKILVGDFHPGAIQLFRAWLKEKYGEEQRLKAAWHDSNVTFENALPDAANLAGEDVAAGIFRDPQKSRAAIDYVEFFPRLIGGFYQKLAAHYKERTVSKALVFMNYGAVLATLPILQPSGARLQTNNNDLHYLLEDKNIDMLVQSQPYDKRNADDPVVFYQPIESINLHNMIYLADYDARTVSSGTLKYGRHRSQYESETILKRDFSWLMIKNSGAWLSDMSKAGWREWIEYRKPWFSTPEVTGPTRDVLDAFAKSTVPKKNVSEIAIIVDLQTPAYEDALNAGVIYRNLCTRFMRSEMVKLGAPYDIVLKTDLTSGKMRDDYKLYIFANTFYLSEKDRAAIEKLKRDGKTLLWFYAPGYVSDEKLDVDHVSRLTGLQVAIKPQQKELLQMKINQSVHSPLLKELEETPFRAEIFSALTDIHPEVIQPVFYIDDAKAETLATYPDGKTAWAARQFPQWKSMYCVVPYLNTQAIRNIARWAGVHLYCEEDIVMAADNRFLMFTNGYRQQRTIEVRLPNPQTVKDAFTGKTVSQHQRSFQLALNCPETRLLRLGED